MLSWLGSTVAVSSNGRTVEETKGLIGWVSKFAHSNHGHEKYGGVKFICQNVGKNTNWLGAKIR